MRRFLRAIFKRLPKVGEIYMFDNENPFDEVIALVTEVKDGWVKYRITFPCDDERALSRSSFHFCYRRVHHD